MSHETPESITEWSDATFGGDVSPLACAVRANMEMAELLAAVTQNQPVERIAEECADVCIVLWRLAKLLAADLGPLEYYSPIRERADETVKTINTHLAATIRHVATNPHRARECLLMTLCYIQWLATVCKFDLQEAVDAKMQVNRARQWKMDGTGCGYHIKIEEADRPD